MSELDKLHDAMEKIIAAFIPAVREVKAYDPTTRDSIVSPAVLIEISEMVPAGRLSDGRHAVTLEIATHCILSVKTANVEREIRNFALKMMQIVEGQRWGLSEFVQRPNQIQALPSGFNPSKKGYESWTVFWSQIIHTGETVFDKPDFLPDKVFIGFAPEIGLAHEDDYIEVTDNE